LDFKLSVLNAPDLKQQEDFGMKSRIGLVKEFVKWGFLTLVSGLSLAHIYGNKAVWAPLDAYCPFGSLESGWKLLTQGGYLEKIQPSNLALLISLLITTLLFGGIFCGWICPLGTLQDALNRLGKKLKLPQIKVPQTWDYYLRWLRLPVLGLVLFKSYTLVKLWFADFDPFRLIFGMHWLSEPSKITAAGWLIMSLFLVLSLFWSRFWCKYLCPFGLVVQYVSKISWFRMRWSKSDCTACRLCSKNCPMGLEVTTPKLHSSACNNCLQCIAVCPRPESLKYQAKHGNNATLAVTGVVVFVAVLVSAQLIGWWNPKIGSDPASIKGWMTLGYLSETYHIPLEAIKEELHLPETVTATSELRSFEDKIPDFSTDRVREYVATRIGVAYTGSHAESQTTAPGKELKTKTQINTSQPVTPKTAPSPAIAGTNQQPQTSGTRSVAAITAANRNPEAIKGYMTLKEVSDGWRIPLAKLVTQLGLPENVDPNLPIKELEAPYGVGGAKTREIVARILKP
jgi:ferredoxin